MDFLKLVELAARLKLPELALAGIQLVAEVRAAAAKAEHILTDGERDELEAVHRSALQASADLDAALAEAERR